MKSSVNRQTLELAVQKENTTESQFDKKYRIFNLFISQIVHTGMHTKFIANDNEQGEEEEEEEEEEVEEEGPTRTCLL